MKRIAVEGPFTDELAERVVREIRAAAGRPIDLRIDSGGGKFGTLIQILLEVEEHPHAVFTTVTGKAWSAAGILAIAGDVRRVDKRGEVMLHYPRPSSRESALQAREIAQHYTQAPMNDVIAWHACERYFAAKEAVQHGLADRVIDADTPEPVRLRDPVHRAPAAWLRSWRELFEEHDLRVDL